jgi:hypothetical protein
MERTNFGGVLLACTALAIPPVVSTPRDGSTPERLAWKADEALHGGMFEGGNRVTRAS